MDYFRDKEVGKVDVPTFLEGRKHKFLVTGSKSKSSTLIPKGTVLTGPTDFRQLTKYGQDLFKKEVG